MKRARPAISTGVASFIMFAQDVIAGAPWEECDNGSRDGERAERSTCCSKKRSLCVRQGGLPHSGQSCRLRGSVSGQLKEIVI